MADSKGKKNIKPNKTRSKMMMTSSKDRHESRHRTFMRVLTLIIAIIVILGLVIMIPFADAAVSASDIIGGADSTGSMLAAVENNSADSNAVFVAAAQNENETEEAITYLPEVKMTSQGAGMFTLRNAALIGGGFVVGFLLGEIFRKVYRHRERAENE
jgi:hypothetical protein